MIRVETDAERIRRLEIEIRHVRARLTEEKSRTIAAMRKYRALRDSVAVLYRITSITTPSKEVLEDLAKILRDFR